MIGRETADLLIEILKSGIIAYCEETQSIFEDLIALKDKSDILQIMDKVNVVTSTRHDVLSSTSEDLSDLIYVFAKDLHPQSIFDVCAGEACLLARFGKENKEIIKLAGLKRILQLI